MTRGGGKITKDWVDLSFTSPDAITSLHIPYDTTSNVTIYDKIQEVAGGGGSGGSGKREIDYFILSSADISNEYVTLSHNSINEEIELTIIEGVPQRYGIDFVLIPPNKISWSNLHCTIGLVGQLQVGDVLMIEYTRQ